MANRHHELNEEFQVDLSVNVKLERCSDFNHISDEDLKEAIKDFKSEISQFLKDKIAGTFHRVEVTEWVDDWTFEVE